MGNENTIAYILEKTAPIFNKQGYVGTSMSDLTQATNLTKGAIYGNFKNKEALAIAAFKYNIKNVLKPLGAAITSAETGYEKLKAIIDYHRTYLGRINKIGGCPIVNVAIDSNHVNNDLLLLAKTVSTRMMDDLVVILNQGIQDKTIDSSIDSNKTARTIYSIIEGAVFMTMTHGDDSYMDLVLDHIEESILTKVKR